MNNPIETLPLGNVTTQEPKDGKPNIFELALQEAEEKWLNYFNGGTVDYTISLGSPVIKNLWKRRMYYAASKNFHFIQVFGSILLGDGTENEAEAKLQDRMDTLNSMLSAGINGAKAELADENLKIATYPNAVTGTILLTSPLSNSLAELFQKSDEYMLAVYSLWIHRKMPIADMHKIERTIKKNMLSLWSSSRNLNIDLRKRISEKKTVEAINPVKVEIKLEVEAIHADLSVESEKPPKPTRKNSPHSAVIAPGSGNAPMPQAA